MAVRHVNHYINEAVDLNLIFNIRIINDLNYIRIERELTEIIHWRAKFAPGPGSKPSILILEPFRWIPVI